MGICPLLTGVLPFGLQGVHEADANTNLHANKGNHRLTLRKLMVSRPGTTAEESDTCLLIVIAANRAGAMVLRCAAQHTRNRGRGLKSKFYDHTS